MRWLATIAVVCVVVATSGRGLAHEPGDGCARARAAAIWQGSLEPDRGAGGIAGIGNDTDVTHYHLEILIDAAAQTLTGSNTMSVTSLVDGLSQFRIRLRSNFVISDVEVGGLPVNWSRVDTVLVNVTLDRIYNSGESFELYVAYSGTPVSRGFGSIEFRTHGNPPVPLVYTLSETWYAYTWWPVKDSGENDNGDKATADLWFTVPDSMAVASNGALLEVDPLLADDGLHRYEWATSYATSEYLFSFSATNYVRFSGTFAYAGGTMPLEFFIYPENNNASTRTAWLKSIDMLGVYSSKFGLYPFVNEKYGIYQFGFGGGMEHQTMTGQSGFGESLTSHELAHQWWGDMITCAKWNDIWLNEGFATYCEALWEEFKPGSPGRPALLSAMAGRRPSSVNGSVYVYDAANFNRIFSGDFSYRKGGWLLHMLRHVVGDTTFFEILTAYRTAFEYSTAASEDFIAVAEQIAGRDLGWFFDPWLYEIGAPEYEFSWRSIVVGGQNYLELFVRQVQDVAYPIFTMPIDIVATVGASPTTYVITNDAAAEHFLLPLPAVATAVAFDPEAWVLATGVTAVSFAEGPPRIIAAIPAPAAAIPPAETLALTVTFHKDVSIGVEQFALVGDTAGGVPVTVTYDSPTLTATIQPSHVLAPGAYTLTVGAGVVGVAGGLALDGEMPSPLPPVAFPSGDGVPGGAAVWQFTVVPVDLEADMNCDGLVNFFDIDGFLLSLFFPEQYVYENPNCDIGHADVNDDGAVNFFDIDPFLELLFE